MCLRITSRNCLTAENKGIECFKVLRKESNGYFSPCYNLKYRVPTYDRRYVADGAIVENCFRRWLTHGDTAEIGLHAFAREEDARRYAQFCTIETLDGCEPCCPRAEYVVVRCQIPRGEMYYSGTCIYGGKVAEAYCSEALQTLEEM